MPIPSQGSGGALGLAAGSSDNLAVAVIRGSTYGVLVSDDGGSSWKATMDGPSNVQGRLGSFLGYQDARTARVSFETGSIWRTTDGGDSWQRSDPVG